MSGSQTPLLGNLRILDLGQYISGPCTSVLLAEMGADVIKVEPPKGDPFRAWEGGRLNATFVAFNRGKRSVVLDLKSSAARDVFFQLVGTADVLVENFRPGVTERLGITHEQLRHHNAALIHCSITGFGNAGPYADFPAYDGVALGYSGLAGLLLDPDEPRLRGPALADAITGHSAAFSILSAVVDRQRTGQGYYLEISMLGALVHFLHSALSKHVVEGQEEGPYTRPRLSQAYVFATADGDMILIHMSSPPKFWEGLCHAVGRTDLIDDLRFDSRSKRRDNYEMLRKELTPVFQTRTRSEWLEVLQAHQVPCAPVNRMGEALRDEQLQHLGIIDVVEEPGIGLMPQIRPPLHLNGQVLPPVSRAPFLGEHTESVLDELQRHLPEPD